MKLKGFMISYNLRHYMNLACRYFDLVLRCLKNSSVCSIFPQGNLYLQEQVWCPINMGGDHGGTGGHVPLNIFSRGDRILNVSPNI